MNVPAAPQPPDPTVQRYTKDGRPTEATVTYERRLYQWMRVVAALLTGL